MSSPKIIVITILAGLISIGAGVLGHRFFGPAGGEDGAQVSLISGTLSSRKSLPDFTLPNLAGEPRKSNEWGGKVLILNFWATWCPPCLEEIPTFVALQEELGDRGLQFVGIAIDAPEEVRRFAETHRINYPVLLGGEEAIELSRNLGNRFQGLPFSVLFNRHGQVVYQQGGVLTEETVREKIAELM